MTRFAKFKLNIIPITFLFIKIATAIYSFLAIVLAFISLDELGMTGLLDKILLMLGLLVVSFAVSSVLIVFVFKKKRIWSNGKNRVYASYGDLIKYAFKINERKIIVIPVNDTFETIVDTGGEYVNKPLVSPNTIHGIWVERICENLNITPETLNKRIQDNLKMNGYKSIKTYKRIEKKRGNLESYSLGTVAVIDGENNTTFYLLAISEFDSNNNAHATKSQIRTATEDLIDFYDRNGQSHPLYMPLMGTGLARAGLTHLQSLKIIKSCILTSEEKINGSINIIVYKGDRDKLSIFN